MTVFLNGRFAPDSEALVPATDRSFLYGDGLFETIRLHDSRLFLWPEHLARLEKGAAALGIPLPMQGTALRSAALELAQRNGIPHGSVRVHLSRGSGPRGYSPRGADHPWVLMTAHAGPALQVSPPVSWALVTSTLRLPAGDPLAMFKTANKLPQICAKAEADRAGADDALMLNTRGEAVESTCASLFWFGPRGILTPGSDSGALEGTTQAYVRRVAQRLGWTCQTGAITPSGLAEVPGAFLTFSGRGLVAVGGLDGHPLPQDPRLGILADAFMELLPGELSD